MKNPPLPKHIHVIQSKQHVSFIFYMNEKETIRFGRNKKETYFSERKKKWRNHFFLKEKNISFRNKKNKNPKVKKKKIKWIEIWTKWDSIWFKIETNSVTAMIYKYWLSWAMRRRQAPSHKAKLFILPCSRVVLFLHYLCLYIHKIYWHQPFEI